MFSLSPVTQAIRVASTAVLLAAATLAASAQTVTINSLVAKGDSLLNGSLVTSLTDPSSGTNTTFVDVLDFASAGLSSHGMHSYGSSDGVFGSRSSGSGQFDVTGSFAINLTLTNNLSTAQNAKFDFHITPGSIRLDDLPLSATQFLETGVGFNITTSNGKSFLSTAVLRDDASGLTFNTTGNSTLYGGAGANRMVLGGDYSLDLGTLAAGESVTLNYKLDSYAKGDAIVGQQTVIPASTIEVPGYWVTGCRFEEIPQLAAFAVVDAVEVDVEFDGCESNEPYFVPPSTVTIPERILGEGDTGGATSQSGDPFDFNFFDLQGSQRLSLPDTRNAPFNLVLTAVPNQVPEPGAMSLALVALAAAAAASRRRKS